MSYALLCQDTRGRRFGSRAVKGPDMVRDLKAVVDKRIAVYLDDLAERGISASHTVPGIEHIARNVVARLIERYDRILTW